MLGFHHTLFWCRQANFNVTIFCVKIGHASNAVCYCLKWSSKYLRQFCYSSHSYTCMFMQLLSSCREVCHKMSFKVSPTGLLSATTLCEFRKTPSGEHKKLVGDSLKVNFLVGQSFLANFTVKRKKFMLETKCCYIVEQFDFSITSKRVRKQCSSCVWEILVWSTGWIWINWKSLDSRKAEVLFCVSCILMSKENTGKFRFKKVIGCEVAEKGPETFNQNLWHIKICKEIYAFSCVIRNELLNKFWSCSVSWL